MILGIAGGNGLEHIPKDKFARIYGVDINTSYLQTVIRRYPELIGCLECLCINLIDETDKLPKADFLIANLLVEYIGYDCFQKAVKQVQPRYVSCIIQINADDGWVSDSPYIHVFDKLDEVHHQVEEDLLAQALESIGYKKVAQNEKALPNGKKLVQLDFMEM